MLITFCWNGRRLSALRKWDSVMLFQFSLDWENSILKNTQKNAPTSSTTTNAMTCQQSAFTTLHNVNHLPDPLYHPYPKEGCTKDLIDELIHELDVFQESHSTTTSRRAMLAFHEFAMMGAFTSPKDLLNTWISDTIEMVHVPRRGFEAARLVLEENKYWKRFIVGDMGVKKDLMGMLKMVMKKSPVSVEVRYRGLGVLGEDDVKDLLKFTTSKEQNYVWEIQDIHRGQLEIMKDNPYNRVLTISKNELNAAKNDAVRFEKKIWWKS
ncbi:hypothetical protein BC829DRAFT_247759 [Chytridium lagenaria]|nr:hypothetical protein BC829DRAFT_247759 [Chytridium lagenaria]